MGPVSIGVEVQRNTDGDTTSRKNVVKTIAYTEVLFLIDSTNHNHGGEARDLKFEIPEIPPTTRI